MANIKPVIDIIADIGGVSALILISKNIIEYFKKPKLKIRPLAAGENIKIYKYENRRRKFINLLIENKKTKPAISSIAILRILSKPANTNHLERMYYVHWADVEDSLVKNAPQPVDIPKGERRLDIVFTQENKRLQGVWLAIPYAMQNPVRNDFYLTPGTYEVEIEVLCVNGKGDKKKFTIFCNRAWEDLNITYRGMQ